MGSTANQRVLAIGDIHGCFAALETLEKTVPIQAEDLVVALGDFIDRGPQSREVLEWLLRRQRQGRLISILGNHEEMILRAADNSAARDGWLGFGGIETLASYGVNQPLEVRDIPSVIGPDHWHFLVEDCLDFFETDTHFFVHANADPDLSLPDQESYTLRWLKFFGGKPHFSGKTMICGHTPQATARPLSLGFAVCIDTGIYTEHGWLTCLDVATGDYWQANNDGETRHCSLENTPSADDHP